MREVLQIGNGFYVSDSLPISAQRAVNWYPSIPQTKTITDANLFGTPGIFTALKGFEVEFCRGAHSFNGRAYLVISNDLVRLNSDNTIDVIGNIDGILRLSMDDNGTQLCIVARPDATTLGKSYIFTENPDSLQEITSSSFDGPAGSVLFSDGFFIFEKFDGKKFFNSELNNGLNYDAEDFSVAEADPDPIRAIEVLDGIVYVFGSTTTQPFRNIARVPSPFAPVGGGVIDVGTINNNTIVKFRSAIYFIGSGKNEGPGIWRIFGGEKQKISTTPIDSALLESEVEKNNEQIYSWAYSEKGSYFVGFSLPDTCFVYDVTNNRWHERLSLFKSELVTYRVSHIIKAYDKIIVGDRLSGNIGFLSEDCYLEYDQPITRFVVSRPFNNKGNPLKVASIEAIVETGVGLANDLQIDDERIGGSNPTMSLSWTDDGGRTFLGGIPSSIGKMGDYRIRPTWPRIGTFSRERAIKLQITSPTKATLIRVEADIG